MKKIVFRGAGTAIVTPMLPEGGIDYARLGELIDSQIAAGIDAIVACGTTGESSTMTDDEHVKVVDFACARVAGRVPVIAGVGSNDTAYGVWLSKEAKASGAAALLHVTPYYNKTSQAGLVRHFLTIADETDLPVILYNVPSRTGVNIKPETYLELSRHENIVATKEANGNISDIVKTRALCGDDLHMYSGNDDQIIPIMSLGGLGVISVASNIIPEQIHTLTKLYLDGDINKAASMQLSLLELMNAMFVDVNPIPVKYAMNLLKLPSGPCRLPLVPPSDKDKAYIADVLKRYGLL